MATESLLRSSVYQWVRGKPFPFLGCKTKFSLKKMFTYCIDSTVFLHLTLQLTSTYESQLPAPCDIYSLADGEFLNKFMSNM